MKGELLAESAVRFVRAFDAPAEKIWAFLTDSRKLPEKLSTIPRTPREKIANPDDPLPIAIIEAPMTMLWLLSAPGRPTRLPEPMPLDWLPSPKTPLPE